MSKKFFTPIDLTNTSASSGTVVDAPVGVVQWEHTDGTMQIGLRGGSVKLSVGQEQVARIVNKTGEDLLRSQYKVVKVSAAQGQRLAVSLAKADADINSADTLGLVAEDIAKNQEGYVATFGSIKGINTTGSLQGETWNDGDVLYLSPTVFGKLTNIKPQAPQHLVIVGFVIYAHQNNGKIFVKIDNGYEIDELHNIRIIDVLNNDLLAYNSSASVWKNVAMSSASVALSTQTSQTNFASLTISGSSVATQDYVIAKILEYLNP